MANKKNLASSLVATAPSPATSGTSLVVSAGTGASFPAVPFFATITPFGQLTTAANSEIVSVTAVSTDTLTIVRAQKGTTAKSVATGWVISNGVYAEEVPDVIQVNNGTVAGPLPAPKMEIGWAAVTFGGAGSSNTFTVNYANTYSSRPIVVCTYGGDQISGTVAYGNGGNLVHGAVTCKATEITTTSFTGLVHQAAGSNWPAGAIVYIQYIIIGS